MPKYPKLRKQFSLFKNETISKYDSIPLDYVMRIPRYLRAEKSNFDYHKYSKAENVVKNIVMRMLRSIREAKNRPSLKETIQEYVRKREAKDERARERIKD